MKMKREFKYFTIAEWEKEEVYLQKMHKSGWKLVGIKLPGIYQFEKCEPEDVVYRLDYNQDAQNETEEYLQLFRDCGWEFVLSFVGYTYFRKRADENDTESEEIFGDVQSKLDMCKRVVRGRMIPLFAIFGIFIVPQLFARGLALVAGEGTMGEFLFIFFVFILYVYIFGTFGWRYWCVKKEHE